MLTYEYKCEKCGNRFEQAQSMKDEPLKTCPQCGGSINRVIGMGAGFIMKGGVSQTGNFPSHETSATRCGRELPCCGREVPCDSPPCKD